MVRRRRRVPTFRAGGRTDGRTDGGRRRRERCVYVDVAAGWNGRGTPRDRFDDGGGHPSPWLRRARINGRWKICENPTSERARQWYYSPATYPPVNAAAATLSSGTLYNILYIRYAHAAPYYYYTPLSWGDRIWEKKLYNQILTTEI